MADIQLTHGAMAIVDDADYDWLCQWKWRFDGRYAVRSEYIGTFNGKKNYRKVTMHRLIAGTPEGMDTDHINGVMLDNRRSNLRICTRSQNLQNQRPLVGKSSKYKGVAWNKAKKKWRAMIGINGTNKWLGAYATEEEAAQAYRDAAEKYFGEFARTA